MDRLAVFLVAAAVYIAALGPVNATDVFDSISTTIDIAPSSVTVVASSSDGPDDNECDNYPCANGGTCKVIFGKFTCICPDGYTGKHCQHEVANTLYPHGEVQGDEMLAATDDDNSVRQWDEHGIQIYAERYRSFFANMNGYITMFTSFTDPTPTPPDDPNGELLLHEDDLAILAPLWTDNVGGPYSGNHSVVFYQSYTKWTDNHAVDDKTTFIMNLATSHIHEYTGRKDFQASNVVIVTWYQVTPYPFVDDSEELCDYQLVIISDITLYRTFAMFNYQSCTYDSSRDNAIFTMAPAKLGSIEYLINKWGYSGTDKAFDMPALFGNVGIPGRILYRLTRDEDEEPYGPERNCRNWMVNQMNNEANIKSWVDQVNVQLPCPCTVMQAILDNRFIYSLKEQCFLTRTEPAQRCCYDRFTLTDRLLIVRFWDWLLVDIPLITKEDYSAGSFILYNEVLNPYAYDAADAQPKWDCCVGSDLCHVYYKYRPLNTCDGYVPPFFSWVFGDPHIRTMDGFQYAFNGFGEFWVQKPIRTPLENYFRFQARTSFAWDEQGNNLQATVFTAFAAKDVKSARVHIELTEDRKSMLILADDNERNLTDWYYNSTSTDPEISYKDVFFRRLVDFVYVSFPSGVALRVGVRGNQLDGLLIVDGDYEQEGHSGLLGTYNGDQTDDFTMPADSAIDRLSLTSSPEDVHSVFGEAYRITTSESLFWYLVEEEAEQYQDPSFEPILEPIVWDSEPQLQAAEDLCQGDSACMYDFYVTENTDFAAVTRDISEKNTDTEADVRNSIPVINGPTEIHVTVLEEFSTVITASDADATDKVTLKYRNFPDDATFDFATGAFKWTPQDMSEVSDFRFIAMDSRNASALNLDITVKLCNCSGNGVCDFENSLPEYNLTDSFQMVYCNCDLEWTGVYCESDVDACLDAPCLPLQDCTDLRAVEHKALHKGFNCSSCPDGYLEIVGVKCEDFDECAAGTDNCDAGTTTCINTQGSFYCSCVPNLVEVYGNDTHCVDFDECALLLDDCSQICTNAFEGYMCDCYSGYVKDADGKTCLYNDATLNETCLTDLPNCQGNCVQNGTEFRCECLPGYTLVGTETCKDVDECAVRTDPCGTRGTPACRNINGSYVCSCTGGFLQGDIRSCGECEAGLTWGLECSRLCNCGEGATCDPVTGCSACLPGWTGEPDANSCDLDIDECSENTALCGEDATCTNSMGSYQCECDLGYYRDVNTCVEINECLDDANSELNDYCQNGATCVDKFLAVECICAPGFTGVQCETNINECDPDNSNSTQHCMHGASCIDLINNFDCVCIGDYFGHYCQHILAPVEITTDITGGGDVTDDGDGQGGDGDGGQPDESTDGGFPVLATALGTVVGAIIIVLSVFCICYCCCWGAGGDSSSTTTETDEFSRPSHVLPRPTWLHWYPGTALKPVFMSAGTPSGSMSTPTTARPTARQVSAAVRGTPAIDWSVLKRFSNRAAMTGQQPTTSQYHRGAAPYTSAGDLIWMPRSRATDLDTLDESSSRRTPRTPRTPRRRSQGRADEFSWVEK